MKMSFIAQYFEKLNIITVLEGRTQAVIRNHFQAVFQTFLKDKEPKKESANVALSRI